jgi:hypothetical protein
MARLFYVLSAVLALHGFAGILASSAPQQDIGIVKTMLLPELAFWSGIAGPALEPLEFASKGVLPVCTAPSLLLTTGLSGMPPRVCTNKDVRCDCQAVPMHEHQGFWHCSSTKT